MAANEVAGYAVIGEISARLQGSRSRPKASMHAKGQIQKHIKNLNKDSQVNNAAHPDVLNREAVFKDVGTDFSFGRRAKQDFP